MTLQPGHSINAAAQKRIADLAALVREAMERLRELEAQLASGSYKLAYIQARLREAKRIVDTLGAVQDGQLTGDLAAWARENITGSYRHGLNMAGSDIATQGARVLTGDPRIHVRALNALVTRYDGGALQIVAQLNSNIIRVSKVVLNTSGFATEIATGMIGGLPRREISRAITRTIRRSVSEAAGTEIQLSRITVGGRNWDIDAFAEMHARTELARASTAGTRVLSSVNGVQHIQVTTHAHKPCICTPFEGRIYSLNTGDPEGFPHISVMPNGGCPMHPNCVHREAPAVLSFLRARGDVGDRGEIPPDFLNLDTSQLAKKVRQHAERLSKYSEKASAHVPARFRAAS